MVAALFVLAAFRQEMLSPAALLAAGLPPLLSALLVFSFMGSYLGTFAVVGVGAALIAGVLLKGDSTAGAR